jgi:hypothetical protein
MKINAEHAEIRRDLEGRVQRSSLEFFFLCVLRASAVGKIEDALSIRSV